MPALNFFKVLLINVPGYTLNTLKGTMPDQSVSGAIGHRALLTSLLLPPYSSHLTPHVVSALRSLFSDLRPLTSNL